MDVSWGSKWSWFFENCWAQLGVKLFLSKVEKYFMNTVRPVFEFVSNFGFSNVFLIFITRKRKLLCLFKIIKRLKLKFF